MREPMKSRGRREYWHWQGQAKYFASRRAMAHIAQHPIVDSQSPVGVKVLVESLEIPGSAGILVEDFRRKLFAGQVFHFLNVERGWHVFSASQG